ncbi:MAG: acyl-CoA thioesterase [Solirubrobacterales bacterium]|nr:acyl-CoA thioesterase [Solirubrobacterales bacterium]
MRWQDIDGLGHVNHAEVLNYFEEGRDAFLEKCGVGPADYVVGRCEVTFIKEIKLESKIVSVDCVVSEIGNSSFRTREEIFNDQGELLVEASFGLVMWDRETSGPRPISELERNAMSGKDTQ